MKETLKGQSVIICTLNIILSITGWLIEIQILRAALQSANAEPAYYKDIDTNHTGVCRSLRRVLSHPFIYTGGMKSVNNFSDNAPPLPFHCLQGNIMYNISVYILGL